jgi:hypothetical protein
MTDHAATAESHAHESPAASEPEALFSREEIRQFDADDVDAGKNLCKMLSLFFFYTVIVMGLSTYVTYKWVVE